MAKKTKAVAATPAVVPQITQEELAEFLALEPKKEAFGKLRSDLIAKFKKGAIVEPGLLGFTVDVTPSSSVSYKTVVDKLIEKHPSLKKETEKLIADHTKPKTDNEPKVTQGSVAP
jgi:hypothetical protein